MVPALSSSSSVSVAFDTVMPRVSSSVIVRVWFPGACTSALPPVAVAETVTVLSAASTSLSTAAMVTTPLLACVLAGTVSVVFALKVRLPATAGSTGVAETVSVTASLDSPSMVAVTVLALVAPLSLIDAGVSTSVTVGVASLS